MPVQGWKYPISVWTNSRPWLKVESPRRSDPSLDLQEVRPPRRGQEFHVSTILCFCFQWTQIIWVLSDKLKNCQSWSITWKVRRSHRALSVSCQMLGFWSLQRSQGHSCACAWKVGDERISMDGRQVLEQATQVPETKLWCGEILLLLRSGAVGRASGGLRDCCFVVLWRFH